MLPPLLGGISKSILPSDSANLVKPSDCDSENLSSNLGRRTKLFTNYMKKIFNSFIAIDQIQMLSADVGGQHNAYYAVVSVYLKGRENPIKIEGPVSTSKDYAKKEALKECKENPED